MKNFILLIIASLFFTSCKTGENVANNLSATDYLYAGHYIGTYSGDDSGIWDIIIDLNGKITGSSISDSQETSSISGSLNENTANISLSNGTTFSVSINSNKITGTWNNSGLAGDIVGEKAINNTINSTFLNTYTGTYSGGDSGTWEVTIAENGIAKGKVISSTGVIYNCIGDLSGTTTALFATLTASNGSTLTATILSDGSVSGTWINIIYSLSGSLSGSKNTTEISSNYVGTFSGTYSGGDSGTWTITVAADGTITGSTTSASYGGTYSVSGTLNGTTATVTATSGSTLTATILSGGNIGGTWINADYNISGSLIGNKNIS